MKLKRGLITQSLSPVFVLLVIRHFHCEYFHLLCRFFTLLITQPCTAISTAWNHEMFGELIVSLIGVVWIFRSLLYIPAFAGTQSHGFHSHGEQIISVEEKRDAAASFLMTFILPLLIDELTTPQYWISYLLVIVVVYAVLYQSNLYYQSPVLALLVRPLFCRRMRFIPKRFIDHRLRVQDSCMTVSAISSQSRRSENCRKSIMLR